MSFPKPHFHWLSTSRDCDSPWPEICLFPPGCSHPSFTLHCIPQQVPKHSFLRLLQKRLSLGEMLGQSSSLRHQRTHNTHLAHPCPSEAGSLPASQSSSYTPSQFRASEFPPLPSSRKVMSWAPAQLQGSTLYQVVARSDGYKLTSIPQMPTLGEKTC